VKKILDADVIQGFVGALLAKRFDGSVPSPECHREWWELCCSSERYVAIAAPRNHAKSTAITFAYTLAATLFRERKFVLIVSDTEAQAVNFLGLIKQELSENTDLINLFGLKVDHKGQVVFNKDAESDLVVEFADGEKFHIIAKGSEQKLRGLLWNGLRPDLIVCDDMENDEIVMNQDRRKKFQRWFYGALLPCRAQNGIVRYVGTILHMDSMLENLMPIVSDKQTVHEDLKMYTTRRTLWNSVKYRAHNDDFTKILWPERWPEQRLKEERTEYIQKGLGDVYSQEYLNVPIDESLSYFKKVDFQPLNDDDRKCVLNYYVTVDLAISEKQKADWSVFLIAGVDENRRIHVKNVIRERLDGKEIVDTLIALQNTYHPVAVGIEEGQISQAIGPFLYETMIARNTFTFLYQLKHMGKDKLARSRSIQARMRAKSIKFDKQADWYQTFEDECMRFPRDKHDDQIDAFSYLGIMLDKLIEAPTKEEISDELYNDELRDSGTFQFGRNAHTGY
jgi:predicted phage terminase large subunit-like protein